MPAALDRRWAELVPLLDELLPLPPATREARLARLELDAELQRLLQELLQADARGDELEAGCEAARDDTETLTTAGLPAIEGYRLCEFLGAGGMASVFLAERQLAGATQRVALKLLRLNVHDPQERRLFQREQATLARLEHVNIARFIDSGFAADGTPWLAVEYVEGESLLAWCDARRLAPRARARLFLEICAAVGAAHQALIVHRDLKPANVLVRADGQVKLVDFGIAKLLEVDAESTRTELRRLTPAYAAPEQFRGEAAGTGADIYALGVILAELLSGVRPPIQRDGSAGALHTRAIEQRHADARNLDTASLRRLLRGDIDAIVARALRPEPAQRYASVDALAADVQAWLEFRPVAARRGSHRYRIGRFLRRNRLALLLSSVAVTALIGVSLFSVHLARRAELAAEQSRADAQRARHVQDFVLSLFRSDEQGLPEGRATSAAELVDRALQAAREDFRAQPESLVPLLTAIGELERGLGRHARSLDILLESAELSRRAFGPAHALTLQAEAELGYSRFRNGEYALGAARLESALQLYRSGGGGDNEAAMSALLRLGMLQVQLNREGEALRRLDEAVQLGRRLYHDDHPALQRAMEIYGGVLADAGELDRAALVLNDNLAMARRVYGRSHMVVASALEALAVIQMDRARLDTAAENIAEAAAILREKAPAVHTMVAYVANTEGVIALRRGQAEAAQQSFQRALHIYSLLNPEAHPMTAATRANLGRAAEELADAAAAAQHFGEALRISIAARAPGDLRIADFRCHWAAALAEQNDARAAAAFDAALALFADSATAVPMQAECLARAALAQLQRGDASAALGLAEQALAKSVPGSDGVLAQLIARRSAAQALLLLQRRDEAVQQLRAAPQLNPPSFAPRQAARHREVLASLAEELGERELAASLKALREG